MRWIDTDYPRLSFAFVTVRCEYLLSESKQSSESTSLQSFQPYTCKECIVVTAGSALASLPFPSRRVSLA